MTGDTPALLAVFAHPDDETFRPGGTLALLAQREVKVHVLTLTRGATGSCGDPPLCTPAELPDVRQRELQCACAVLGIQPPYLLDYPDGHLAEADPEKVIAEILVVVHAVRPQVMLSFGPDGLSGHPDHIAIGRCAAEAFHRAGDIAALYTVAVPQSLAEKLEMRQVQPVPDQTIALTVDVYSTWEIKLAAMGCHATQWSSSPMVNAPEKRRRLFFGREYFVRVSSHLAGTDFLPEVLQEYLQ